MKPINLVYLGTPDFSATILKSLIKNPSINVIGVVTQPDKPKGRKMILAASPVAQLANKHNIPVFKPSKLDQSNLQHIKLLQADIFLTAAYGQIIPPSWLETPKVACLNIHFSLLPKYRGALCVSDAIKNQDPETGVTLMQMDKDLDHGPIITQLKQKIDTNDNVETLTQKLKLLAIKLVQGETLLKPFSPKPQNHKKAIYTLSPKTRTRQSAYIKSLTTNGAKLHALIRSLNPDPGAWTMINGQEIKIIETQLTPDSKLNIITIQLPGKNPISWSAFVSRLPSHSPLKLAYT
jgi:methionyl-tRNA formyltransferase